jgi:hypothetical protein
LYTNISLCCDNFFYRFWIANRYFYSMSRQVKSLYQTPKYTDAWEQCPQFKEWLSKGPVLKASNNSSATTKAYCMLCEEVLEPTFISLSDHAESSKHSTISRMRRARNSARDRNGSLIDSIESRVDEYFKMKREFSIISSQVRLLLIFSS